MPGPTLTHFSLPSGVTIPDGVDGILRPTTRTQAVGTGPYQFQHEWDTDSGFGSPLQDINTPAGTGTVADDGIPPSDMGGATWYYRCIVTDLGARNNEIHSLYLGTDVTPPSAGTFTLSDGVDTTSAIAWDATAATVATRLETDITSITDVTVTGAGTYADPYLIEYVTPGFVAVPLLTVDTSSLTPDASTTAIDTAADDGITTGGTKTFNYQHTREHRRYLHLEANVGVAFHTTDTPHETQLVGNGATSGTFTLTFSGQTTAALDWDATASEVETALENLSNITDVEVRKVGDNGANPGHGWEIKFIDVTPDPIPLVTATDSLTGGSTNIIGVIDDEDPYGTTPGGTEHVDGHTWDYRRYLHLLGNVGVGFKNFDEPLAGWGVAEGGNADGGDGDEITFNRYLHLLGNVDSTQPCPYLFALSKTIIETGSSLDVSGQGLVSGDDPTDTYDTEVRLYETASFAAAYVVLPTVTWDAGETTDTITVTIPGGASSGYVAVVHTTGATCTGSNFLGLTVVALAADRYSGWWVEVWNLRNSSAIIKPLTDVVEAGLEHIPNDIGSGYIILPADHPDIPEIIDRQADPPVQRLVKVYEHNRFAYGFIPDDLDETYSEDGAKQTKIYGKGQETVLSWGRALGRDFPAQPSTAGPWQYGSDADALGWGSMDPDSALTNGGAEDARPSPWEAVGTATLDVSSTVQRNGQYSLKVTPAALDDGASNGFAFAEGERAFVDLYIKEPTAGGGTFTAAIIDQDANVLDSAAVVATGAGWLVANLEYSGAAVSQTLQVRVAQTAGTLATFYVDDVAAYAAIGGTRILTGATVALSRDYVAAGLHSMEVACEAGGDASFKGLVAYFNVTPNQEYRQSMAVTGPVGKTIAAGLRLGGDLDEVDQVFTGLGTWDIIELTGIAGATETTARFELASAEALALTFYVDAMTISPGQGAAPAGEIAGDVLTSMQTRGTLDFVQTTFDDTYDSAGFAWPEDLRFTVQPEWSMWNLCEKLVGFGYSVELVPTNWRAGGDTGWDLNIYGPLRGGTNWSAVQDGPTMLPGNTIEDVNPSQAPPASTVVYGEGAGGLWTFIESPATWLTALERREDYVTNRSAIDATTLFRAISHRLDVSNTRGAQFSAQFTDDADPLPYFDFWPMDQLRAHFPTNQTRDMVEDDSYVVAAVVSRLTASGRKMQWTVDFGYYKLHAQRIRDLIMARMLSRDSTENYQPGTGSVSVGGGTSSAVVSGVGDTGGGATGAHTHVWTDVVPLSASGDLAGIYPGPTVAGIRGRTVESGAPADGEALLWDAGADKMVWGAAGGGGAGSDTSAIHDDTAAEISAIAAKATPTSSDYLIIEDAADSDAKKKITIGDLPAAAPASHTHTESDVTDLDHTDATAIHDDASGEIAAVTEKASPVNADLVLIEDSEASNVKKRVQLGNLPGGGGASSPLTTKGDVWGFSTVDARIPIGTDGQVLTADAAAALGLKWETPAAGGGGGLAATVVVKSAAESVTSSTTLQDDDELLFAIGANETWVVEFYLHVDGATGGDIKVGVTGPTGATGRVAVVGPGTSATTFENATTDNQSNGTLGTGLPAGTLGTGAVTLVRVSAAIINGANAGNVTLQWAQRASSGTATRVLDGSYLVAQPIGGTSVRTASGVSVGLSADMNNLTAVTDTAVVWDTEVFDTDSYWEGVTNPTRFTVPTSGKYLLTGQIGFYNVGSANSLIVGYSISGGSVVRLARHDGSNGVNEVLPFVIALSLTAGQYIEVWAQIGGISTGDIRAIYTFAQLAAL